MAKVRLKSVILSFVFKRMSNDKHPAHGTRGSARIVEALGINSGRAKSSRPGAPPISANSGRLKTSNASQVCSGHVSR
eukprot:6926252-Prymnesium_polylepis.1